MNTEEAARAFKALGDENRLRIARIVAERGDVCACRLLDELDMTQPTLSHHMKRGEGEEGGALDALLAKPGSRWRACHVAGRTGVAPASIPSMMKPPRPC